MFESRSPLEQPLRAGGRDGLDGHRGVRLSEVGGWELAQLAVFRGQGPQLATATAGILGADPRAAAAGQVARSAAASLYRTAPDAWWVVSTRPKVISQLVAAVPAGTGTVTPLSHSRVRLALEGPGARAVLCRGISVDLDPGVFGVGAFAQTGLHHTGVLLERSAPQRYELYVLRTYALSIWEWLVDAALPEGYEIIPGPQPAP